MSPRDDELDKHYAPDQPLKYPKATLAAFIAAGVTIGIMIWYGPAESRGEQAISTIIIMMVWMPLFWLSIQRQPPKE